MKTCPSCLNDNSDGAATCLTCGYSFDRSVTGGDKTRIVENKITGISTGDIVANRYIVEKELGRGGMGVVYLARDSELRDTKVALKVIHPSLVSHDEALDRFIEEVITSQRLTHQNIVKVYDLKRWQDLRFFTMEYVEGRSLKKWITERNKDQKPPFNLQETVSIIEPLLEALTYAHKRTIHRDIKPENIMVRGDFPDVSIKVLDFGIAKTLSTSRFTQTSQSLGTAYYMSPEQMTDAGGIDHRADLYSVGMILYEMLTGKLAVGIPVLPSKQFPDLPPAVDDMIVRLLSVSPGDRYPDAESTRKALSKVFEAYQIHQEAKKKEAEDEIAGMLEKSRMYIEKHQWAEAIGSLIRAKKLAPENKQIKEQLAIAGDNLKKKEKKDEIAKMLERGRIFVEHRRWIDGERALKRVLDKDPDNTEAKKWLFKAVQGKKALERLTKEVKEAERSGELSAAIQLLKRSKPLSSDPEQVEQRISRLQKLIGQRKPDNKIEPDREHAEIIKPENQEVAKKQVHAIETKPDGEIHKAKRKWNFTLMGGLAVIIIIGAVYFIQNMRSDYISDNRTVKEPVKKTARLYVETEPSEAKVRILNIIAKYKNGMELDPGRYHLEVSADGYETRKKWVTVGANKDEHLKISLPKIKTIEPKIQNSLGMKFVYIRPGTFMMGSSENEKGHNNDEAQHKVTLTDGYYLQTTEVTQGQWKAVMGSNPSYFTSCGEDCPVEQVSWEDVQRFIKKLNRMEGTNKYRLPTEAEWEYAARAGTSTPFAFGNCLSTDQANYDGNHPLSGCSKGRYRQRPLKVASFIPNTWGLYDMHGNVWEWCHDWYGNYPNGSVTNPKGPLGGSYRVIRGGSWNYNARYCRSANRYSLTPGFRCSYLGFRLARTL